MSQLGYDLAYAGETPFEGEEGMTLALRDSLKKYRLSGIHYTPNMDIEHDLEKIALRSLSGRDFQNKVREYLTSEEV